MKSHITTITPALSQFAKDVREGLSSTPKRLSSKYFYDAEGDKLFQDIMKMPEYYLTDSEFEIFDTQKEKILDAVSFQEFDLIELGAGDGYKTKVLLSYFLSKNIQFQYRPVDISGSVLNQLKEDLTQKMPDLRVNPLQGEYFKVLEKLSLEEKRPKIILFLGANIGNFRPGESYRFLRKLYSQLNTNDLLIIGFDLKKDPQIILDAYNDPTGITAAFNLNLLERMNKELGATFNMEKFKHWETYNPLTGATRSFILSKEKQSVQFSAFNKVIQFEEWEAIEVELSQKYTLTEVEQLALQTGFTVKEHFFDQKNYFVDSLWRK